LKEGQLKKDGGNVEVGRERPILLFRVAHPEAGSSGETPAGNEGFTPSIFSFDVGATLD